MTPLFVLEIMSGVTFVPFYNVNGHNLRLTNDRRQLLIAQHEQELQSSDPRVRAMAESRNGPCLGMYKYNVRDACDHVKQGSLECKCEACGARVCETCFETQCTPRKVDNEKLDFVYLCFNCKE